VEVTTKFVESLLNATKRPLLDIAGNWQAPLGSDPSLARLMR